MRKYGILILLACIITENVLAAGGLEDINDLSLPDVQIELPPELVGIFKFIHKTKEGYDAYGCIEVYEDNRYWWYGGMSAQEWGYVIEESGDYYLLPLGNGSDKRSNVGSYIVEKTKIVFIENGISFTSTDKWNEEFVALRDPDGFKNLFIVIPTR